MTGKDLQKEFIKTYLKPLLKEYGYRTPAQLWHKRNDRFLTMISLQNSAFNEKNNINFCFNIGISLSVDKARLSYFDDMLHSDFREASFLTEERRKQPYRKISFLGYKITNETDMTEFIKEFEKDWKGEVLPLLENLKTLRDWKLFYQREPLNYMGSVKKVLDNI